VIDTELLMRYKVCVAVGQVDILALPGTTPHLGYSQHSFKSFASRTFKIKDLKPFRIRTYDKKGEGEPRPVT
jgi:hypothetical protein